MQTIKTFLFILLLLFIAQFTWHFVPPLIKNDYEKCGKKYPLMQNYNKLNIDHQWKVDESLPWETIETYKQGVRDGLEVSGQILKNDDNTKDLSILVNKITNNKRDGFSLGYNNGYLVSVDYYKEGKKDGIHFSFHDLYPSMLVVYSNDEIIGLLGFLEYGRIRDIKFGTQYKDFAREEGADRDSYKNGQKAFGYIKENGIKFWIVYDENGQVLLKYPVDNDFCKAQFFDNGRQVEIPFYFDEKEFERVYHNIKDSVTKNNNN